MAVDIDGCDGWDGGECDKSTKNLLVLRCPQLIDDEGDSRCIEIRDGLSST